MDNNLKLRRAIIIATMVIGGSYSLKSNAIGLGDMHVRSYLGQPLIADLTVYGVNNQDNAACFHVKSDDTNTIHDVNFSLNRTSGGNAKLNIKSRNPVIEPIASLTIMNTCGTLFTRQYNLLIDPAPTTMANNSFGLVTQNNTDSGNFRTTTDVLSEPATAKPKTKKTKPRRTKATSAKKKSKTVARKKKVNNATKLAQKDEATKPVLTISGGNLIQANDHSVHLNLDKSFNPNRQPDPIAFVGTDFADELTVMQNRVSHLDKQLSKLSIQNAQLKKTNTAQAQALSEASQKSDFWRIIAFCLAGALLASSYFFIDWIRRRNEKIKADKEQALWHAMQKEQDDAEAEQTFNIDETFKPDFNATQLEFIEEMPDAEQPTTNKPETDDSIKTEKVVEKENTEQALSLDNDNIIQLQPSPTEIIEEDTQVLEDVELFVSHGRTSLAIEVLQSHLLEHPKESASIWMYLLDLLVKEGMEKEYEIAAKECNKHFNIRVAAFSANNTDVPNDTLESFERISAELQKRWGTPEAVTFLDELMYNTRIEPRVGFSQEIFEELSLLREIAQDEIRLELPESGKDFNQTTTIDLPEVEASDEFKAFGHQAKEDNKPEEPEKEDESFEFELMDINRS